MPPLPWRELKNRQRRVIPLREPPAVARYLRGHRAFAETRALGREVAARNESYAFQSAQDERAGGELRGQNPPGVQRRQRRNRRPDPPAAVFSGADGKQFVALWREYRND